MSKLEQGGRSLESRLKRIADLFMIAKYTALSSTYKNPDLYDWYVRRQGREKFAEHISGLLSHYLPIADNKKPPTILDVATGTGLIAQGLIKNGYAVIGLDLNHGMLKKSIQRNKDAMIVENNFNQPFPLADNTVDGATSVWANRYLSKEGTKNFIQEIYRVIRPGGVIVWPIFPAESLIWKMRAGAFQPTMPYSLARHATQVGFQDIQFSMPSAKTLIQNPLNATYIMCARK